MSVPAEQTPGWPELVRVVDANHGAYKTTMLALRTVHGSARISERIGEDISHELAARGLGHFPDPLPIRQEDAVTLYRKGSLGAEVFSIMHDSAANGAQDALARAIRLINEANVHAGEEAMKLFEDMSRPKKRRPAAIRRSRA